MKMPKLTKTEAAKRAALKRAARPRLASTIVLYTGSKDNPKILMGQRSARNDFMPSVYVFPGGRVDRSDSYAPFHGDLNSRTEQILEAAYPPRKARAIALAAIRETWEETGLMLGRTGKWTKNINDPSWDEYRKAGKLPNLSNIEVFGRAVTPPHRHKRYDTWFFVEKFDGNPNQVGDSGELSNVGWYDWGQIKELEMQRATTMMLAVLKNHLSSSRPPRDIFYSRMNRGTYIQDRFPHN